MNEELEKKLLDSIDKVQHWVDTAEGFAAEQAPLVVQEVINWGIASSAIYASCCFVAVVSIVLFVRYCWRMQGFNDNRDRDAVRIMSSVFGVASTIGFTVGFFSNLHSLIFVLVAPRLYVLEQLSNLVK